MTTSAHLIRLASRLGRTAGALVFGAPVGYVYNPLVYAAQAHAQYLARYADGPRSVVFLGMNPGPWGMTQTGVPFGDVDTVRFWLGIDAAVRSPAVVHPSRPVLGLGTSRVEVSGKRLWGLIRDRYRTPAAFFRTHFVANYCPLMFLDADGRNLTPDKLSAADRGPLLAACDLHLARLLTVLEAKWVVGVGGFAASRAREVVRAHRLQGIEVGQIPHPSPASPMANRGWAQQAETRLVELGIWKPR